MPKERFIKPKKLEADQEPIPEGLASQPAAAPRELPEAAPDWTAAAAAVAALRNYFGDRLRIDSLRIGSKFPRPAGLVYLEGTTDPGLVAEYSRRLRVMKVELLEGTAQLARLLEDRSFWLFPGFQSAACPETAAAALYQGQLLLLTEGDAALLMMPGLFLNFFKRPCFAPTGWLVPEAVFRLSAFAAALFLPAFYIALASFQYYAVPVKLFFLVAEARIKTPFPPVVEVLLLEAVLEMIREGARKITATSGDLISVIGGLLAAAGLAGTGLVNPVAAFFCGAALLASLAFAAPDLLFTMRCLMFASIVMTEFFGVLGMIIVASLTVANLVSLETADWPYLQKGNRIKRL